MINCICNLQVATQNFKIHAFQSCTIDLHHGSAIASEFGPLLFSIYINDLPSCSDMFKIIMYADDTNIFCDLNNDHDIEILLNNELCKITDWFQANKLSLNVDRILWFFTQIEDVLYTQS